MNSDQFCMRKRRSIAWGFSSSLTNNGIPWYHPEWALHGWTLHTPSLNNRLWSSLSRRSDLLFDFSLVRRCHSLRQLASSTRTRRVKNIYERQFHVPVQPLASEPSQAVVRIHHLDHNRVIIANQIITHSHPILSEACNVILILGSLCPRSAVGHQFSHPERIGELGTTNWV